jgi:hypothetical protein
MTANKRTQTQFDPGGRLRSDAYASGASRIVAVLASRRILISGMMACSCGVRNRPSGDTGVRASLFMTGWA